MTMRKAVDRLERNLRREEADTVTALVDDTTGEIGALRYLQGRVHGLCFAADLIEEMRKHYDEEGDDADRDPD
jgi:hypothetical protein